MKLFLYGKDYCKLFVAYEVVHNDASRDGCRDILSVEFFLVLLVIELFGHECVTCVGEDDIDCSVGVLEHLGVYYCSLEVVGQCLQRIYAIGLKGIFVGRLWIVHSKTKSTRTQTDG